VSYPADPTMDWNGRRVLLTGHTGFKGSWLSLCLHRLGARVTGLSDRVPTDPSLYELARIGELVDGRAADVRDADAVRAIVDEVRPEVVIHMAAQPFVRRSFREPSETYATNVMGTVNVLEAIRRVGGVRVAVVVTSDKCYDNREQGRPFTEDDPMGGHDPYSNSKGCAELVTSAYRDSFFAVANNEPVAVASARAGNVIGGGDWGEDRLIPDIMNAALAKAPIPIRNPTAVRPWQHVLNPLAGYLALAGALWADPTLAGGWNFGPDAEDVRPVGWLADRLTELWPEELRWELDPGPHPHEAGYLALDSTKARERLGWVPVWDLDRALTSIVDWYLALRSGADMRAVTVGQADAFLAQDEAVA
jgi:CDP-glucose 4,6-dehydratase